ncbi:hypothetical protein HPP92_020102 [Vanilla planifolia]|uniref:Uncharacterized protein n=1 Tax=Vanilla planifolia TaxID=51239 RepID=A0A835ULK0_VANPL|nr:hypothetical protein HPP92_020102 [Vanilla planifolia]
MVRRMVSEGDARWLRIRPCEVWWAGINLGVILDDAYMGQQTGRIYGCETPGAQD